MSTTGPSDAPPPPNKIDRTTITPFLLNLYYRQGGFHRLDDFRAHQQPRDHIQIYTWRDCTLHELSILLSDALPLVCPPRSRCGFRLIYADTRYGNTRYTSKDLGAVVPAGDPSLDQVAKKTLNEVQFVVGDWIDVAIYPEGHGGVSSARGFVGGRGGVLGGPRENGFGGFKVRGGARGGGFADRVGAGVPSGEWRRGEKVEDTLEGRGPPMGRGGGSGGGFRRGGGRRYRD
ncbi:Sin3 associated polypeptide p18-domain-containing protein [Trichophaea hybrida]|nr:Sin3 associated polypeptide p18-domain-containing protein [Trichophaea hybrida]